MSMLDSFFNKGFKATKCKTLLKLTIPRIKLLRNRREIQLKQMRRDIAKLLETGQEATARIRVEHIIREEKMMAAQEVLELFCELISVRLPIIEAQRECPLDLKEAIASVCFAAPRCADLPELQQAQMMFAAKYGREFVLAASELMPDCGVNRQIIELLSIRAPPAADKLKLLKEIAEEHELDWDPAASEAELFKSHEDLLNGSTQYVYGSKLPLPKEKHDDSLYSAAAEPTNNEKGEEEEAEDDSLDFFPEVPKASVIHTSSTSAAAAASAPLQMFSLSPPRAPVIPDPQNAEFPEIKETLLQGRREVEEEERVVDNKQFLPFISPPSLASASFSVGDEPKERETTPPAPPLSRTRSEAGVDLQDVIAAAHAAAESAERAAAAARSAASLAQLRISELNKKNDSVLPVPDSRYDDNPFGTVNADPQSPLESPKGESELPEDSPIDTVKFDPDSSSPSPKHHPERLPSMDEDPYTTYPSLFSSQNSMHETNSHLFNEARFDRDP